MHSAATALLVRRYVEPLLEEGADTLVLGCMHYPFALPLIEETISRITSRPVAIVDTGEAVTRRLVQLLEDRHLLRSARSGETRAFTTGGTSELSAAFSQLLGFRPPVTQIMTPL